jgi:hypothetical protein
MGFDRSDFGQLVSAMPVGEPIITDLHSCPMIAMIACPHGNKLDPNTGCPTSQCLTQMEAEAYDELLRWQGKEEDKESSQELTKDLQQRILTGESSIDPLPPTPPQKVQPDYRHPMLRHNLVGRPFDSLAATIQRNLQVMGARYR